MQRIEHFNSTGSEKIYEHGTNVNAPSMSRATPSASVDLTAPSAPPVMVELCTGKDYKTGSMAESCACNLENTTVKRQLGDGKAPVDMCTDGSAPKPTGVYCKPGQFKVGYDLDSKKIEYRMDAITPGAPSVTPVTRRWCA